MLRKLIFPLLLGLAGIAILVSLGVWQLQRLDWKRGVIADAAARLTAAPVDLPADPDPATWNRRPVTLTAATTGDELHILTSGTAAGTGYRVIAAVETMQGRRVMADLGLLPLDAKDKTAPPITAAMTGNLIWPDDVNSSTPVPDLTANIWFGRDVAAMARHLETEPLLVTLRAMDPPDPRTTLLPMDSANFKNDHLEYAITWFSLAAVWAAMTVFLMRRTLQKDAT